MAGLSPPDSPSPSGRPTSSHSTAANAGGPTARPKFVSFRKDTNSKSRTSLADDPMNEHSPLLRPRDSEDGSLKQVVSPIEDDDWNYEDKEQTKSSWYLLLLTLTGGGLQISWSVETSNGSPFLLSLGLSKSLLALVWIAGPLSGVLVQPYVGLKSDNCRLRWGKRRPFIIMGAAATIISLLILAWSREIVAGFLSLFGADPTSNGVKVTTIVFASLFVYVLDFAINLIQAAIRAFVVDCAPTHQQEAANAWVLRCTGVGNILGYMAGYIDLPRYFPFFGNTQFKVLCMIASLGLAITVAISCSTVHERDPRSEGPPQDTGGLITFFRNLYHSVRRLPPQIKKVCAVQFFAWVGWFPFLFYITTYVGGIYVEPYLIENPNLSDDEINALWERATRVGTLGFLVFAFISFGASVFLPWIIPPTYQAPSPTIATPLTPTTPGSMSGSGYFSLKMQKPSSKSMGARICALTEAIQIPWLTLRRAWLISHIIFAILMWSTLFIHSVPFAVALVGVTGICWALTNWAPFALISSEISKRDAIRRGLLRAPPTREAQLIAAGEDESADQAGVVLGIHNVAISMPQVFATIGSSLVFKALQRGRGEAGDTSVAWVLRIGGLFALIAAWFCTKLGEEGKGVQRGGGGREASTTDRED